MKKLFLFLMCMPFLLATTCEEGDEVICTQEAKAGLNITVKDAVTQDLLSVGETVIVQDGLYSETIEIIHW